MLHQNYHRHQHVLNIWEPYLAGRFFFRFFVRGIQRVSNLVPAKIQLCTSYCLSNWIRAGCVFVQVHLSTLRKLSRMLVKPSEQWETRTQCMKGSLHMLLTFAASIKHTPGIDTSNYAKAPNRNTLNKANTLIPFCVVYTNSTIAALKSSWPIWQWLTSEMAPGRKCGQTPSDCQQ